ncbi:MAG: hypothetical protein G3I11_01185 [Ferrovum sp.]|nr:hypothetical protein [Ferrovum sp.]
MYDFWVSPKTGEEANRCPWFRKVWNKQVFKCQIYNVRPDACRNYPVDREQMQKDECEVLEPEDLILNEKEFQILLDKLRNTNNFARS